MKAFLFFALLLTGSTTRAAEAPKPPGNWTCDVAFYQDGVCDCGCTAKDPDCGAGTFTVCERHACPEGKAPWEHEPWKCMTSVCGDGWRDERAGEVCDDGNALASGGCSADCKAISPGYLCGDRAEKCAPDPSVEPEPVEPEPESNESVATGGCAGAGVALVWPLAALVLLVRRRKV